MSNVTGNAAYVRHHCTAPRLIPADLPSWEFPFLLSAGYRMSAPSQRDGSGSGIRYE